MKKKRSSRDRANNLLPPAMSAHTPLDRLEVVHWPAIHPANRRGPIPGTLDRYGKPDRALYPELKRLMDEKQLSATAAANELANTGKVKGIGTPENRARRLVRRYNEDCRKEPR